MTMARIDHGVTTGTFSLDGETFDVDNNIWVMGDDTACVVIDAPHSVDDILAVVGRRRVTAIVCTHAHDDHVRVAPDLARATGAPILLHPADAPLWALTHPDVAPDADLADGQQIAVGGISLTVLHTPGHSPGSVSLYAPDLGAVFTGDTLFQGSIGRSDLPGGNHEQLLASIARKLLVLGDETVVLPGHGGNSSIGAGRSSNPFLVGLSAQE